MRLVELVSLRLRALRARHDLTQERTAALLGADVKWYQRIEWHAKDLRASTIDRLAAVFGVTSAEFLGTELPVTKVCPPAPAKPPGPAPATKPRREGSAG